MLRQSLRRTAQPGFLSLSPRLVAGPSPLRRCLSTEGSTEQAAAQETLLYTSPFARPVQNMKRFSFGSCVATTVGAPALLTLAKYSGMDVGAMKMTAAGLVVVFGAFSTALLHALMKGYVSRLWLVTSGAEGGEQRPRLRIETMTLTGRKRLVEFDAEEADATGQGVQFFTTFRRPSTGARYYLHEDVVYAPENGQVHPILQRLVPRK